MLEQSDVDALNSLFKSELELNYAAYEHGMIWDCKVGPITVGQYRVVPLITPRKVKSEGYLMQNCCRDYIQSCQAKKYLLFSIGNRSGQRIATLGTRKDAGRSIIDDCLGRRNEPIMEVSYDQYDDTGECVFEIGYTEIFSVAHEIVRLLNVQSAEQFTD